VEDRAVDHPAVQLGPECRVDAALEEQAQRHEVDADRSHRPRIVATGMLHGIRVNDERSRMFWGGFELVMNE